MTNPDWTNLASEEQPTETWSFFYGGEWQEVRVRTDIMLVRSTPEALAALQALESEAFTHEDLSPSVVAFRAMRSPDPGVRRLGVLLTTVQNIEHLLSSPGLLLNLIISDRDPDFFLHRINLDLARALALDLDLARALALDLDLARALALDLDLALDLALALDLDLARALALARALDLALARALDLARALISRIANRLTKEPLTHETSGAAREVEHLLRKWDAPWSLVVWHPERPQTGTWEKIRTTPTRSNLLSARASGLVARSLKGDPRAISDRVVVELRQGIPKEQVATILEENGLRQLQSFPFAPGLLLAGAAGTNRPFDALRELLRRQEHKHFSLIEPVLLEPIPPRWTPRDPDYPRQWQWNNTGQNGGKKGADARVQNAWNSHRGKGVRIAVIDNGMNVDHPDLKDAIQRGGCFESLRAGQANFVPLTAANRKNFPCKDHGTFCCGMAAAQTNEVGGCGAAPEAELIPVACLEDQLSSQVTLARAVAYAANPHLEDSAASPTDGADVISCSLGPRTETWQLSAPLRRAIEYARKEGRGGKGCAIFWAVNNDPTDTTRDQVTSHPDVLAVSRSNNQDDYDGAAHGRTLAFVAPGKDVLSATGTQQLGIDTGTSYSTALAAGVGALVLAVAPTMTAAQLGKHLKNTCDKVGTQPYQNGRNDRMGHGRINAEKAVSQALAQHPPPAPTPPKPPPRPGRQKPQARETNKSSAAPGKAPKKRGRSGAK